nr:DOMON-like domain-containing protein [Hyphomonas sp. Mor2]
MSDQPVQLHNHPTLLNKGVERLSFQAARKGDGVELRYDLIADLARLSLPETAGGERRDGLWEHTCFEAFFAIDGAPGYVEFNFAPNGDWAAYRFTTYREQEGHLDTVAPTIETQQTEDGLSVCVTLSELPADLKTGPIRLGPSAVIETRDGNKSYWALHHLANKPDFHLIENFKFSLD